MTIDALKAALSHLKIDNSPVSVRAKSRDFFWYSPVLKARMEHMTADLVVGPKSEAEVIEVLRLAHRHAVPMTLRGAGTGNYGQAMPVRSGHLPHEASLQGLGHPPRPVIAQPGRIIRNLDAATPRPFGARAADASVHLHGRHYWRLGRDRVLHQGRAPRPW